MSTSHGGDGTRARGGGRGRVTTRHAGAAPGRLGSIWARRVRLHVEGTGRRLAGGGKGPRRPLRPPLAAFRRAGASIAIDRRRQLVSSVGRREIAEVREVIRPYVRVTPVVEVRGADFGLTDFPIVLK